MFGIGMPELILILAVALVVIGPKKLPDLAKSLGRAMNEFRKASRELKDSLDVSTDFKDVKDSFRELKSEGKDAVKDDPPRSASAPAATPPEAPAAEGKVPPPAGPDAPEKDADGRG